ncbi:MAG: hypothetical protein JXA67_12420, partial [Micromonosporaceae bacterium]|nr:hypothetical protein [Micromonosporaceae bacterium]
MAGLAPLSGCDAFGGSADQAGGGSTPSSGPPWLIVVQGSATPSAVPTFAAPASSPPAPLPTPPAVVRTAVTPGWVPDPCGGRLYEGK